MGEGIKLRRSDMETFLECRQKWAYTGPAGHDLEPRSIKTPLFLGSAVHAALEEFHRPRPEDAPIPDPREVLEEWGLAEIARARLAGIDCDEEDLLESLRLGKAMLEGYLETWGDHPSRDTYGLRFLATELPFEVAIPGTDGWVTGTVDGLVQDREGRFWVFETKTYTGSPPSHHHMNFQTLTYAWAMDTLAQQGHPLFESYPYAQVYGSIYNGLRKQRPGARVTRDLFVRTHVARTRDELARFSRHLSAIYREMTDPDVAIYPTITRSCEWCAFVDPCYAKLSGANEEWMLELLFQRHVRAEQSYP